MTHSNICANLQALPRVLLSPLAGQATALAFARPAPDPVLDVLVDGVGQTLGPHGAAPTDLERDAHAVAVAGKKDVTIHLPTSSLGHPARTLGIDNVSERAHYSGT
jgi:hypothetical protein